MYKIIELLGKSSVVIGETDQLARACIIAWNRAYRTNGHTYVLEVDSQSIIEEYDLTWNEFLPDDGKYSVEDNAQLVD